MTKYAEDLNYWRTGSSAPDSWMDKTKKLIRELGYKVMAEGFGSDHLGQAAYMLAFRAGEDDFKIVWPVLPTRSGNERYARIQAATMMYHYAKAVCLFAAVVGVKTAFFSHLMLPDGRVVSSVPELERMLSIAQNPDALALPGQGD